MKKIICVLTILLAIGVTMPAKLSAQTSALSWCGKSGTITKAEIDSLIKNNCKRINIADGKGAYVSKFTCVFIPKGAGREAIHEKCSLNLMPGEILNALKSCKVGDYISVSEVEIKKGKTTIQMKEGFTLKVQ